MEGSLVFHVDQQEELSEDEDDIQRKQELQRLLSEQLCDDGLIDSGDSSSDDTTFLSPPRHTHHRVLQEWALSEALSTHDIVATPTSPSVQQSCSHEPIITSDTHTTTPLTYPPPAPPPTSFPLSISSHLDSSNGAYPTSLSHPPPTSNQEQSNIFTGTSQAYEQSDERGDGGGGQRMGHLDRGQLELLYNASCRQVCDLERQLTEVSRDVERELGAVRHELRASMQEREELANQLVMAEDGNVQMRGVVSQLQDELAKEKNSVEDLMNERESLLAQLRAAQHSVDSLTAQVEALSSSDALTRLRHHYETALSSSTSLHLHEVAELKQERASLREHTQEQENIIAALRDKLSRGKRNVHFQNRRDEERCEEKEEKEEEEEEEEGVIIQTRLVAQVEDYQHQLSTVEEELRMTRETLNQIQVELVREREGRSEDVRLLNEEKRVLVCECDQLRAQLADHQAIADANKKTALEQCRSACLKLHEEATNRLRQSLAESAQRQQQKYQEDLDRLRRELGTLQHRLTTAQQQYVEVCLARQDLGEKGGGGGERLTACKAVQTMNYSEPKIKEREKMDCEEKVVTPAVNVAERQEEEDEELKRSVDIAVNAAHQLWKKQQDGKMTAMVQQLKQEWTAQYRTQRDAAVRSALVQAKHHYEEQMRRTQGDLRRDIEERVREQVEEREKRHKHEIQQLQQELSSCRCASEESVAQCQQELRATILSLKTAMTTLMVDTLMSQERYAQQRLREEREKSDQDAHQAYLECLHHLVNSSTSSPSMLRGRMNNIT